MSLNNIYYQASFRNPSAEGFLARFDVNRTTDILTHPQNYYSTVDQFSLPLYNIPLIQWLDDFSYVGLRFGSQIVRKPVNFIPNSVGVILFQNPIYQYQHIIRMVNKAFKECFDDLVNLPIGITQPPRITYDAKTQLCSIWTQIEYENVIDVILDNRIFSFFANYANTKEDIGLPFTKEIRILTIKSNLVNVKTIGLIDYICITQDYVYIQEWTQFDRLLIETSSIPINPQSIGSSSNIEQTVLTDFLITKKVNNRLSYINRFESPLSLQTTTSEYPLRRIDMRLSWFNGFDLTTENVLINNTGSANVKLVFTNRLNQILLELNDESLDS